MGKIVGNGGRHNIYQIYYDSVTESENDKGFLQLDNLSNERPDWAEYWPIRKFLLAGELEDDCYYGFLSPKFGRKTGLASSDVFEFLNAAKEDVVAFSPFYDLSAFSLNVFEQAGSAHRGIYPTLMEAFGFLDPSADIRNLVMTSRNTIFCNYFAAKKDVWRSWLAGCEKIYGISEANESSLATMLNASVKHSFAPYPAKVFVVERVISYLLSTNGRWSVRTYNPMKLPYSMSRVSKFKRELSEMDALKIAYCETGYTEYLHTFSQIRSEILARIRKEKES